MEMITPESSFKEVDKFLKSKGCYTQGYTKRTHSYYADNPHREIIDIHWQNITKNKLNDLKELFPDEVLTQEDILAKENAELKAELSQYKARIGELKKVYDDELKVPRGIKKELSLPKKMTLVPIRLFEAIKTAVGEE